jgi:hypothetical protein
MYLILGRPLNGNLSEHHGGVGKKPIWRLYESTGTNYPSCLNGLTYGKLKETKPAGTKQVCDITVEGNHNFVLHNGLIAHNCDDYAAFAAKALISPPFDKQYTNIQILSVQWLDSVGKYCGHNVAVFKNPEATLFPFCWIGNWYHGLTQRNCKNLEEIAFEITGKGQLISWFSFTPDLQKILEWKLY